MFKRQQKNSRSHAAGVFSEGGAVADEWQLLLRLRFRLRLRKHPDVGEAVRHYSDLRLVVRKVVRVHRQPPVVPPAAVATVTIAVHAVFAHQKRRHGVRRARRRHQEGFAALSGRVGADFVAAPDVAGERSSVGLIEEGVDQRVDPRGDVAHPDEDVEEVVEQRLVAGAAAQDEGDVGDEEGTPHDEEEEEDDSQDLRKKRGEEWKDYWDLNFWYRYKSALVFIQHEFESSEATAERPLSTLWLRQRFKPFAQSVCLDLITWRALLTISEETCGTLGG